MSTSSRITLAAAALALALALALAYVFPIWSITLEAPQYPEGIGMYIQINTVTGHKPNDLKNINGLNHYIGMKTIEPDAIAELKLMPWIIGVLLALGLVTAAMGKRWMLYTWVGLFVVVAVVGLVDFYLWTYDYGHNLDPTAAIKVPGMAYQPPLIGSKQLLNFTAHSWPGLGGWMTFLSMGTGLALAALEWMRIRRLQATELAAVASLLFVLGLAACTPGPRPLVHGQDACAHCKMTITDERYGAELVTRKGKVYTFDAIECLAAYQLEGRVAPEDVHSLWVVDFQAPPNLVEVNQAFFLHSRDLRSPMGMNLTSFGPDIRRDAVQNSFYGDILDWNGVLDLVRAARADTAGMGSMHPAHHGPTDRPMPQP